jgi:hypothetical protein
VRGFRLWRKRRTKKGGREREEGQKRSKGCDGDERLMWMLILFFFFFAYDGLGL